METISVKEKEAIAIGDAVRAIGQRAKKAAAVLASASTAAKNLALTHAAQAIREQGDAIIQANQQDVALAVARNITGAFLDRLRLNPARLEGMAKGLEAIAALPDPVGRELASWQRDNGLQIQRISVPLGVIGIIYESRPNVTADAGGLCLKSGNAAILRGGSESFFSSAAILACLQTGLKLAGLPEHAIQALPTKDRAAVGEMLRLSEAIDVIVPRGGKGLIKRVIEESRVPTLQHLDGNCHIYIHAKADLEKTLRVVRNAKLRRTGICGAAESLVVDQAIAGTVVPQLMEVFAAEACEVRGDHAAMALDPRIRPATSDDWSTEYLDHIVSLKVVHGLEEGIAFVQAHSSSHTDCIMTEDENAAAAFLTRIDSAIVMQNTSTQFADGGEFGMGAEIGIATGKLHARGPVGLEQLNTFKYLVKSEGAIRS